MANRQRFLAPQWRLVSAALVLFGVIGMTSVGMTGVEGTTGSCNGAKITIVGTQGNDTIRGTEGPDVIYARGGR